MPTFLTLIHNDRPTKIQYLQNQLDVKNDQIFELEATSATYRAESIHQTQQAERLAQKRVHLVEEELRRTRMEAEKYKGSWIRQKKRVAELESGNSSGGQLNGGGSDRSVWNDHFASSNNAWGRAADEGGAEGGGEFTVENVELRRVTPNISNDDHADDTGDRNFMTKIGHAKRMYRSIGNTNLVDTTLQANVGGVTSSNGVEDSGRQRLARLILNRDEMGCHSLGGSEPAALTKDGAVESVAVASIIGVPNDEREQARQGLNSGKHNDKLQTEMHQDHRIEKELRAFVKSILWQMVDAPEGGLESTSANGNLSVSGLCQVLLVKFNALFRLVDTHNDSTTSVDELGDHPGRNSKLPSVRVSHFEQQRLVLLAYKREGSEYKLVTHATISWRAVLYLLSVIHDMLLLSAKLREDLRWWLHQSRQSGELFECTNGDKLNSPRAGIPSQTKAEEPPTRLRIEGLLSIKRLDRYSNANWQATSFITDYESRSFQQLSYWDPISINEHYNDFFELIVGLMKGNVRNHSKYDNSGSKSSNLESEQNVLAEIVQLKAIELVSTIMSDADPDDHGGDDRGWRTPSLWNLWLDALLPSLMQASDAQSIGGFFSPREKSDPCCASFGNGRMHSTQLLKGYPCGIDSHKTGKNSHTDNRSSHGKSESKTSRTELPMFKENVKVEGHLAIRIKGRILRLITHATLCSRSVQNCLYQSSCREMKSSLAKRVLAAVLDCMEEYIAPFLSSDSSSDVHHVHDTEQCLRFCLCCIQFLTILTGTHEGVRLLRMQMRLESGEGEPSRWSQSAIGCITTVLSCALDFVQKLEKKFETSYFHSRCFSGELNALVGECIHFFNSIHLFLEQENDFSSKAISFVSLVSEHSTLFESCCQRILACQSRVDASDSRLLHVSGDLRNEVRDLLAIIAPKFASALKL